jgi:hypothetical protein
MRHPLGDEPETAGKHVANDRCFRHRCSGFSGDHTVVPGPRPPLVRAELLAANH